LATSQLQERTMAGKTRLQDLIAGGALPVGSEVYHESRNAKRAVSAPIRGGGIEIGGNVFGSPSGAARAVSGTKAENGWVFWRVRSTGKTLSELRAGS
jgi:hypothetical protein